MEIECFVQPGKSIKPTVDENQVKKLLLEVYGLICHSVKELNGYDDSNYHVYVDPTCDNKYIEKLNSDGYVLKIINSLDSKEPLFFEGQNDLLIYLDKKGVCCPRPVREKMGDYYVIKEFASGRHVVRLLEFIKGSILHQVPTSRDLFFEIGKFVAELDEALKDFHHPAYEDHKSIWHLQSVPQLQNFLSAVTDDSKRKTASEIINQFSQRVTPICTNLQKGIIHGDFNEQNILVEEQNSHWHVKGILDFGDSHSSCYLYELAIAMTYMMIQARSIDVGGYVLAGYKSVKNLPDSELQLLKVCVAGRLCQSLVLGAYSSLQDPNNVYILTTSKPGWKLLQEIWAKPEMQLLSHWERIAEDCKPQR